LALGYNPGGATDGTDLNASDSFYENWEHDFVCFRHDSRYLLAGPAFGLLARSLDTDSIDVLRTGSGDKYHIQTVA